MVGRTQRPGSGQVWGRGYHLAIIGGGINGCGIARDAAGRGIRVFLCDEGDLGRGGSSASPKLLHGGPRRLSRLAGAEERESLAERDILLASAPHVIRPVRLVLPVRGAIAAAVSRTRLAAYDRVTRGSALGASQPVTLGADRRGATLLPGLARGFEYADCMVDDSRLVVLNAIDARTRGADIRPRTRCVVAEREGTVWRLALEAETGERYAITARALVNAAGPWAPAVLDHVVHGRPRPRPRLVKGTTIVVQRLYDHDRGYVLRNTDGRTIFIVPYQGDFTLIGTSEEDYDGDPAEAAADSADIGYLIAAVSEYFSTPVYLEDLVWAWAGVRALPEHGERRLGRPAPGHAVDVDGSGSEPPLVTVVGGTIAGHRRLAERVVDRLAPALGRRKPWTAGKALPGGLFPADGLVELGRGLRTLYPFLAPRHAQRLVSLYGTRAHSVVSGARTMADLGQHFGADLTEAEVRYLMREEWAETAEDVLWRRTKLGLRFTEAEAEALEGWMAATLDHERGMFRAGAA